MILSDGKSDSHILANRTKHNTTFVNTGSMYITMNNPIHTVTYAT